MAFQQKRLWGLGLMALTVGMGCSSVPGVAVPASGGGGTAAVAAVSPIEQALTQTDRYFITQYQHRRYNPAQQKGNNANCGPTSLAMAVRAFGKEPAGMVGASKAYELIRHVRYMMTGEVNEQHWTYPVQVRDGARKLGLKSDLVFGVQRIAEVMRQPGRVVVVNVNPSPAYAEQLVTPYAGGHFALLTRIEGDRAYLSDPLAPQPVVITLKQLEIALTTPLGNDPYGQYVAPYNGGVVLWDEGGYVAGARGYSTR